VGTLKAVAAYIDLNPVRAKMVEDPKTANGTPVRPGYSEEQVMAVIAAKGKLTLSEILHCRIRYFTDGVILGRRVYVEDRYESHRTHFARKGKMMIKGCEVVNRKDNVYTHGNERTCTMRQYTAVVEHCPQTNLYVGYVPGFPGAHTQGETLDELSRNLQEVVGMLLEDGEPQMDAEFVGTQSVVVA
jgi:predicted RNase H-like HicB family nuclease